jgi:hypothetical protein
VLDPDLPIGPTWVEVDLDDGRTLAGEDRGTETRDLAASRTGVIAKFHSIADPMLSTEAASRLRDEVISGALGDVRELLVQCAVPASSDPATSVRNTVTGLS